MDAILLDFIKENMISVTLGIAILKAVANATPWAVDNEILQIITCFLDRNKKY